MWFKHDLRVITMQVPAERWRWELWIPAMEERRARGRENRRRNDLLRQGKKIMRSVSVLDEKGAGWWVRRDVVVVQYQ